MWSTRINSSRGVFRIAINNGIYTQKRPVHIQKRPTFAQKRPTYTNRTSLPRGVFRMAFKTGNEEESAAACSAVLNELCMIFMNKYMCMCVCACQGRVYIYEESAAACSAVLNELYMIFMDTYMCMCVCVCQGMGIYILGISCSMQRRAEWIIYDIYEQIEVYVCKCMSGYGYGSLPFTHASRRHRLLYIDAHTQIYIYQYRYMYVYIYVYT